MSERSYYIPAEILEMVSNVGVDKARRKVMKQLLLAFMAGAFIAFAAEASTMASFNHILSADSYDTGRLIIGLMFGAGLMLVTLAGGELFTGNTLMVISLMDKKIKFSEMMINWCLVWIGNFIGALLIAAMMSSSGLYYSGDGLLGEAVVKIAYNKINLSFYAAFISGVLCNWLVCGAIWLSYAAKDVAGKVLGVFFVIFLFATSGFEHAIANMYYIPAGILAKPVYMNMSDFTQSSYDALNWGAYFLRNLLPVTLGNTLGGAFFIGVIYRYVYKS